VPDAGAPAFDGVIVVEPGADHVVGGLRLVERAAFTFARAGARRLLLLGSPAARLGRMPDLPITRAESTDASVGSWLTSATPHVLVAPATTVVDPATIAAMLAAAEGTPVLVAAGAAPLWRYDAATLGTRLTGGRPLHREPTADAAWQPPPGALLARATDAASRAEAERALYSRLGRSGDGWFTRHVDRRFSRALTRIFLPTGIAPNAVTLISMTIGIVGGCCFAAGTPILAMIGAVSFLASTIIDGCDGEIARLTFRESTFGARLDILGDNLVHLFLFGGIAVGLYRRSADPTIALLGVALVIGVCVAMAAVYLCIVRRDPTSRQRMLFDAFASREFAYFLVVLTVAGRLDWFLWMSAFGTYVFAIGLFVLGSRRA
jgi:phosphatidylglycerophosphate synthase